MFKKRTDDEIFELEALFYCDEPQRFVLHDGRELRGRAIRHSHDRVLLLTADDRWLQLHYAEIDALDLMTPDDPEYDEIGRAMVRAGLVMPRPLDAEQDANCKVLPFRPPLPRGSK
jgi:hypothetical protein